MAVTGALRPKTSPTTWFSSTPTWSASSSYSWCFSTQISRDLRCSSPSQSSSSLSVSFKCVPYKSFWKLWVSCIAREVKLGQRLEDKSSSWNHHRTHPPILLIHLHILGIYIMVSHRHPDHHWYISGEWWGLLQSTNNGPITTCIAGRDCGELTGGGKCESQQSGLLYGNMKSVQSDIDGYLKIPVGMKRIGNVQLIWVIVDLVHLI